MISVCRVVRLGNWRELKMIVFVCWVNIGDNFLSLGFGEMSVFMV